jgi:hypothetical protein
MKKRYWFRIRIFLMTLALGLACVMYWDDQEKRSVDGELAAATIVDINIAKVPRFTETSRACGPGYTQAYVTNDGLELRESSGCYQPKTRHRRLFAWTKQEAAYVFDSEADGARSYVLKDRKSGHCIDAPTYELAVELRNYLEGAPRAPR